MSTGTPAGRVGSGRHFWRGSGRVQVSIIGYGYGSAKMVDPHTSSKYMHDMWPLFCHFHWLRAAAAAHGLEDSENTDKDTHTHTYHHKKPS